MSPKEMKSQHSKTTGWKQHQNTESPRSKLQYTSSPKTEQKLSKNPLFSKEREKKKLNNRVEFTKTSLWPIKKNILDFPLRFETTNWVGIIQERDWAVPQSESRITEMPVCKQQDVAKFGQITFDL